MRGPSTRRLLHGKPADPRIERILLDPRQMQGPVDLAELFGNRRPVEIEIGSGKGTFLLARARARPELNLLGIEYAAPYGLYAADRLARAGCENARMLIADAAPLFRGVWADSSVLRVHLYFPDPWPKRRHHRRRIVQPAFVQQVRRVLIRGGQLIVATDHRGYYEHIRRVMLWAEGFARTTFPKMAGEEDEVVGTNFEKKYIAEGRPVYSTTHMKYR
jgi:tRNA (guanine-N7-)-methyltransferase